MNLSSTLVAGGGGGGANQVFVETLNVSKVVKYQRVQCTSLPQKNQPTDKQWPPFKLILKDF